MNIGNLSNPSGSARPDLPARAIAPQGDSAAPAAAPSALPGQAAAGARRPGGADAGGQQPALSQESAEKVFDNISAKLRIEQRALSISVNDELGRTIVTVIDPETDEVIRQIPSEELVRFALAITAISEQLATGAGAVAGPGLLIDEQA